MEPWIIWTYLVVLAVWIGSVVFFSFFTAPTIFRTLDPENAGRVIRAIFPKYYLLGIVCAALGIVCVGFLLGAHALPTTEAVLSLLLLAGMGASDLWMRQGVAPRMNELRIQVAQAKAAGKELDPALERDWKAMHRLSVQVNGGVLLCGLVLLFVVVYSRAS